MGGRALVRGAVDLQHVPRARLLVQPVHVLRDEAPGGPVAALQARERLVRRIGLHVGELVPPGKAPRPAPVQSFSTSAHHVSVTRTWEMRSLCQVLQPCCTARVGHHDSAGVPAQPVPSR